jgi:hypothetical protein
MKLMMRREMIRAWTMQEKHSLASRAAFDPGRMGAWGCAVPPSGRAWAGPGDDVVESFSFIGFKGISF